MMAFLQTPSLFRSVFHRLHCFVPEASRKSVKNGFYEKYLNDDQIHDELDYETLDDVYQEAMANSENNLNTLIILDDVQKALKNKYISKLLLHAVNNRRHAKLSIWLCAQNYMQIPLQVRMGLTDMFVFKINKKEITNLCEEQLEMDKPTIEKMIPMLWKDAHDYMYLNTNTQRVFRNWDEIIYKDNV